MTGGRDGQLKSRIVPTLAGGSIVTDPRSAIHYLVTEYGMVNLKGRLPLGSGPRKNHLHCSSRLPGGSHPAGGTDGYLEEKQR